MLGYVTLIQVALGFGRLGWDRLWHWLRLVFLFTLMLVYVTLC